MCIRDRYKELAQDQLMQDIRMGTSNMGKWRGMSTSTDGIMWMLDVWV